MSPEGSGQTLPNFACSHNCIGVLRIHRLLAASAADPGGSRRSSMPDRHAARLPPTHRTHVAWLSDPPRNHVRQRNIKSPVKTQSPRKARKSPFASSHTYEALRSVLRTLIALPCAAPGDQEFLPEVWRMHSMPICCRRAPVNSAALTPTARALHAPQEFGVWMSPIGIDRSGMDDLGHVLFRSVETPSRKRMIAD